MGAHQKQSIKDLWKKTTAVLCSALVFSGFGAGLFGSSRAFGLGPRPVFAGQQEDAQKRRGVNQDRGEHTPQPFTVERPYLLDVQYLELNGTKYLQRVAVDVRGIDVGTNAQLGDRHGKMKVTTEWRPKERGEFYTFHYEGNDGTNIRATFELETGIIYQFKGTLTPPEGPAQQMTSGYLSKLGSHLAKLSVWAVESALTAPGAPPIKIEGEGRRQGRSFKVLGF